MPTFKGKPCVAWVPCNLGFGGDRLFEPSLCRDNATERFAEALRLLKENGFESHTCDVFEGDFRGAVALIFYGFTHELRWIFQAVRSNPEIMLINIPIEPPVVAPLHDDRILKEMPFDCILTWNDILAEKGSPFLKANIGEAVIQPEDIPTISFDDKKFLAAVYSNKMIRHPKALYEERLRAFRFFSTKPEGFDLYGVGWGRSRHSFVKKCYKGECASKREALKNYKFTICFENARYPGLITEKIFDCFAAGTVPIYYGAPNVERYIPKACFVDFRDFEDYETLYRHLVGMTDEHYQDYLKAAVEFLKSDAYLQFTSTHFAELVCEQIQMLLKAPPVRRTVSEFKWKLIKALLGHPLYVARNIRRIRCFLLGLLTKW